MDNLTINVAFDCLFKVLGEMSHKHFIDMKELSEYEQRLLIDLQTCVINSQYHEVICKHFSTKK